MPKKTSLTVLLILTCVVTNSAAANDVTAKLKQCATISNAKQRLACYDALAVRPGVKQDAITQKEAPTIPLDTRSRTGGKSTNKTYITPSQQFLQSELVVTPWESEYALSIKDFVNLLSNAVQEDGQKIILHGWRQQNEQYILDITMKSPLKLVFQPEPASGKLKSFSLLAPVQSEQGLIDASLFIMTIAAMIPDEQSDN